MLVRANDVAEAEPMGVNNAADYVYLEPRPDTGSRQYYVKGRRAVRASLVVEVKEANNLTVEEVAHDYRLPVDAIRECIRYCEEHQGLIEREICAERIRAGLYPDEDKGAAMRTIDELSAMSNAELDAVGAGLLGTNPRRESYEDERGNWCVDRVGWSGALFLDDAFELQAKACEVNALGYEGILGVRAAQASPRERTIAAILVLQEQSNANK